ncbi:ABC transporter ATP-binding protein [Enterococcus pseudoavium]|uniref:ABC transporter ATP-binding protein n=1 Tax=Enterococcus pseudoavium TaxID=44007 RepID=A0AAE4I0D5_9ENTE|nr:ABC transporter ATP-binding protein [Enterococcus pseudoavium]MDT2736213.1 ABC transporter ATP-binding protein [Enterococcus pseudoavium]REC32213.1 peptide ABC transporter ATP-binding protein [Enterococcus pseudoavium]
MEKILEVNNLNISFDTYAGKVRAIRGVDFDLNKGETLAIVGESGSGKSVTTRTIMRLLSSNATIDDGEILFKGQNIVEKSEKEMQKIRGREIAMIFQDPMTSLDPTMTIGKQVAESLRKHKKVSKKESLKAALDLLKLVGIPDAEKRLKNYPHQFSGGQRQRIVIAIALICNPEILIADEPTTALDVTIQAQILELLKEIQEKIGTSIIFITHDLGVVANVADRVAVMYAGKIVEVGTAEEIFYNPQHPYTWGLLGSMPTLDSENDRLYAIPGSPPDLLNPPKGDAFYPRNEFALKIDAEMAPPFFELSATHKAATWLLAPQAPAVNPPAEIQRRWEIFRQKQAQYSAYA